MFTKRIIPLYLKNMLINKKLGAIYNVPYNPETNPISALKQNVTFYDTHSMKKLKAVRKSINKVMLNHLENYLIFNIIEY